MGAHYSLVFISASPVLSSKKVLFCLQGNRKVPDKAYLYLAAVDAVY